MWPAVKRAQPTSVRSPINWRCLLPARRTAERNPTSGVKDDSAAPRSEAPAARRLDELIVELTDELTRIGLEAELRVRGGLGRAADQHDTVVATRTRRRLHGDAQVRADVPRGAPARPSLERLHDILDAADDRVRLDRPRVRAVCDEQVREVTIVARIDRLEELVDQPLASALDDEHFEIG